MNKGKETSENHATNCYAKVVQKQNVKEREGGKKCSSCVFAPLLTKTNYSQQQYS